MYKPSRSLLEYEERDAKVATAITRTSIFYDFRMFENKGGETFFRMCVVDDDVFVAGKERIDIQEKKKDIT